MIELAKNRKITIMPAKKSSIKNLWFFAALIIVLCSVSVLLYFLYPGFFYVDKTDGLKVVLGSQPVDVPAVQEEGEFFFPVNFVGEYLDADLFWDEAEERLTITTAEKVLQMKTGQLTAYLNRKPLQLNLPVKIVEEEPYIPLYFLRDLLNIEILHCAETKTIIIDKKDMPFLKAVAVKNVFMRSAPTIGAPRVVKINRGQAVRVYKEDNGWYYLRTETGLLGYAPKKALQIREILAGEEVCLGEQDATWHPWGGKISLVFEQVIGKTPALEALNFLSGFNVLAPTWFHLYDEEGNLQNLADYNYVKRAGEQGCRVWALFSNNFDPDKTSAVLRSSKKREKVIDQLLAFSSLYELDGINVDFENLHFQDRDYLTQFMRELTPLAREQGLTVSIDVTFPSNSANWSLIYDRGALSKIVDYVIVMAYDEHWGTSPVAGSVASLPWVERGLVQTLSYVPAEKLILGVPLYTRLWEIEYLEGGGEKVSSKAYGMDRIKEILNNEGAEIVYDETTGQNYASFEKPGSTCKVWLEDFLSLEKRLDLVKKFNLAGTAAWRRGLESEDVWELFSEKLFIESVKKNSP